MSFAMAIVVTSTNADAPQTNLISIVREVAVLLLKRVPIRLPASLF